MTKTKRHREGSRKQKVHQLYNEQGDAAAFTLGRKLGLEVSSLQTWFSNWRTEAVAANLVKNAKAKAAKAKVAKVA
jgi:hypothetical protein